MSQYGESIAFILYLNHSHRMTWMIVFAYACSAVNRSSVMKSPIGSPFSSSSLPTMNWPSASAKSSGRAARSLRRRYRFLAGHRVRSHDKNAPSPSRHSHGSVGNQELPSSLL